MTLHCVLCHEMVEREDQIWPKEGGWRHGDCPGMGTLPSLSKMRADFDDAMDELSQLEDTLKDTLEQTKKHLEELEDE